VGGLQPGLVAILVADLAPFGADEAGSARKFPLYRCGLRIGTIAQDVPTANRAGGSNDEEQEQPRHA
jgi:hypothetical protein